MKMKMKMWCVGICSMLFCILPRSFADTGDKEFKWECFLRHYQQNRELVEVQRMLFSINLETKMTTTGSLVSERFAIAAEMGHHISCTEYGCGDKIALMIETGGLNVKTNFAFSDPRPQLIVTHEDASFGSINSELRCYPDFDVGNVE